MRGYVVESETFATPLRVAIEGDTASVDGQEFRIVPEAETGVFRVISSDRSVPAVVECEPTGRVSIWLHGYVYHVRCIPERFERYRELVRRAESANHAEIHLRAPMPGLVKAVHAVPGTHVRRGESIIVLEAMKMENLLRAPTSGIVRSVPVAVGSAVEKGELLCVIEAEQAA